VSISSRSLETGTAPVLVLSPRYSSDSRILRLAAIQRGWQVERLGGWDVPARLLSRKLIFSGEFSYSKVIAHKLSWALLDAPPDWLLSLPIHYRKRTLEYTTLAEARTLSQARFVKPAIDKVFAATVYPSGAHLFEASQGLADTIPVLVSEPVCWDVEYRFFVCERRVVTFSSYWSGDRSTRLDDGTWQVESGEIAEAQHFMDSLLTDAHVKLPPAIVIDVGKIRDRGWAVIEANAAWAAGIYGCDPLQVLSVLEHACVHRAHLTPDLAAWECNRDAKRAR